METFKIIFLLCLSWASTVLARPNAAEAQTTQTGPTVVLGQQCGGNMFAPNGVIYYSPRIIPNRRCVWFIQAPNVSTYHLEIKFTHQISENNLILTTFNYVVPESHYYANKNESLTLENVGVLMVTFYTPPTPKHPCGFGLYYTSSYGKGNPTPFIWQHQSLQNGTSIDYPRDFGRNTYHKLELTCFLFAPQNGILLSKKVIQVCYRGVLDTLSYDCEDHLTIYSFGYSSKWKRMTSICGEKESPQKFENDDLILAVFESDRYDEAPAGFSLSYNKNC